MTASEALQQQLKAEPKIWLITRVALMLSPSFTALDRRKLSRG